VQQSLLGSWTVWLLVLQLRHSTPTWLFLTDVRHLHLQQEGHQGAIHHSQRHSTTQHDHQQKASSLVCERELGSVVSSKYWTLLPRVCHLVPSVFNSYCNISVDVLKYVLVGA